MDSIIEQIKKVTVIYRPLYWLYVRYLDIKKRIVKYRHRQRSCSYGDEYPDKTFYIIGVPYPTAGLFAIVKSVFCHICYAVQHGYLPVVDMQHFRSQLSDVEGEESMNVWELYFQQPGGFSLENISRSKNIIRSCSLPFPDGVEIGFDTKMDEAFRKEYAPSYKSYIVPTPEVASYADNKRKDVIKNYQNVLGVLCRGTDYTENKPTGHPIQPTAEQAVAKAKDVMAQYGFDYVFLATEDKRIYNFFKEAFGDRLLFSGQKLYEGMNGKKFLSELTVANYSERWHNIVDYYSTIYILSKCDGLLAGLTCGSISAFLMSKGFRYTYFWNLGRYK